MMRKPGPNADMTLKFWGVRGSIACADASRMRYGGNTSCLEIRCAGELLIFDAGTGLRYLGASLNGAPLSANLFLTHTHFDHVCGLPFFAPFFDPANQITIWSGHLSPVGKTRDAIAQFMATPFHPVPPEIFRAKLDYHDFAPGAVLQPSAGVSIRTARLNHPDGAVGYRVEFGGASIAYVTDTEHVEGTPDAEILDLISGADIFVYDAMYTDEEYRRFRGMGHSTWREGAKLADLAGAKTYVAFHHAPEHDDAFLDRVAKELEGCRPGSLLAREGMILTPRAGSASGNSDVTSVTGGASRP